jgi:PAS domain S-box-containing protein
MWIDDTASENHLRTWVKHCPAMKLVSTLDGQILWANAAFCDWSQYTLSELRKLTWMQISVPDKNLEADIDEAKRLDAYNPSYQIKKQYVPKGAKPEWGQLTVMRYPLSGEIECCLCTWEPLKNGTATAFAMAMEHTQKLDARIEAMTAELKVMTGRSDEENFILSGIRMIQRHPKIAAGFLVVALSIFGLNNIVELLQRTGLIHLPVKIEKAQNDAIHADAIGIVALEKEYAVETQTGHTVSVARFDSGLYGPVSFGGRGTGRSSFAGEFVGGTITSGHGTAGRENGRLGAVPPGKSF